MLASPSITEISQQRNGQPVTNSILLVFITPTITDPAGNPIHPPGKEPFDAHVIPPQ